ncbi:penicillin-binding transpeptidase domain-containing protein [Sinosporangium siamense]|uniref:penicillin-binding transpeptidase domain-containing protein n=1 Tax=Sinosporangium siamense TaxID=1367973 RepID=UPI0035E56DCE
MSGRGEGKVGGARAGRPEGQDERRGGGRAGTSADGRGDRANGRGEGLGGIRRGGSAEGRSTGRVAGGKSGGRDTDDFAESRGGRASSRAEGRSTGRVAGGRSGGRDIDDFAESRGGRASSRAGGSSSSRAEGRSTGRVAGGRSGGRDTDDFADSRGGRASGRGEGRAAGSSGTRAEGRGGGRSGESRGGSAEGRGGGRSGESRGGTAAGRGEGRAAGREEAGRPAGKRAGERGSGRDERARRSRAREDETIAAPGGRGPRPPMRPPNVLMLGNPRRRINIGLIAMTFVLSVFAGRLVQMQGLDSKIYEAAAAAQRVQTEVLPARRGSITDVNGHELAVTVEAREISADPQIVPAAGRDEIATALATDLGRPKEEIAGKLAKTDRRYVRLARGVDPVVAKRIMARKFKGISSKHEYRRTYPGANLAGSLVGFVGDEDKGLSGLEQAFNDTLSGRDGSQTIEMGREGQRIPLTSTKRQQPVPGRDVRLTIDRDLQWAAQKVIADQVRAVGARSGSVIVMDVKSGDILAMANAPELDLNKWQQAPQEHWVNRSVSEVFEPGSTNKVITAAAALEAGAVRPETEFLVRDSIQCADRTLKDAHPHPPERLTFSGVVATSSNVGTILAAQKVGDKGLHDMLKAFGFGERPGGGLPGAEGGVLPKPETWSGSQRCTIAYGQGISVTALQTASVYQTIANGGVRVTPRIVAGTTDAEGELVPAPAGEKRRVVSQRTAKEIGLMLEAAVSEDGTGNLAAIPGYRVGGKTGTAMRYDASCQGYCGYTATFVGFTPAEAPELVVSAVIQDPRNGHFGGQVAAPVFKDVATFALKNRKIAPTGATPPKVRIRAGE